MVKAQFFAKQNNSIGSYFHDSGHLGSSSSYVRSPRRLEYTLDGTSEAGLLVAEVITWLKIIITEQNFVLLTIWIKFLH